METEKPAGSKEKALIFEVKGNSLDDGPGIRTVIFFKGCPLDCAWCHNPESKRAKVEIIFDSEKCIGCGTCLDACPEKALQRNNTFFIDRKLCTLCLECTKTCPSNALSVVGKLRTIPDIMNDVMKDRPFFQTSGGGISLSGGEPTLAMDFAARLLQEAKSWGINTLLETCGLFDFDSFETSLYPFLDIIYFDIKLFDPTEHKKYCGKTNEIILRNFEAIHRLSARKGLQLLPRIPLIPGITATRQNLVSIADFLKRLGAKNVELLPYNPLWISKIKNLGLNTDPHFSDPMKEWMSSSFIEECKGYFSGMEVR